MCRDNMSRRGLFSVAARHDSLWQGSVHKLQKTGAVGRKKGQVDGFLF